MVSEASNGFCGFTRLICMARIVEIPKKRVAWTDLAFADGCKPTCIRAGLDWEDRTGGGGITWHECVYIVFYFISRCVRPEGPWQWLRRCRSNGGRPQHTTLSYPRPAAIPQQPRVPCRQSGASQSPSPLLSRTWHESARCFA